MQLAFFYVVTLVGNRTFYIPFFDRKGTPFVYILLKNGSPFTYIITLIFLSFYAAFIKWVHASARNISVKDLL